MNIDTAQSRLIAHIDKQMGDQREAAISMAAALITEQARADELERTQRAADTALYIVSAAAVAVLAAKLIFGW